MGIKENYKEITDAIIAGLEKAASEGITMPWIKPWGSMGALRNAVSGHNYRGINLILLAMKPYKDPRWLTFKQAKAKGGSVKTGEKGTKVIFWSFIDDKTDPSRRKKIPLLRLFTVFNVEQTEGCNIAPLATIETKGEARPDVEEAIAATGAAISYNGGGAAYIPSLDQITMPSRESFKTFSGLYSTLFHELGHWTGNKDRCDRDLTGRFGNDAYAFEELVAELTAAFSCRDFLIDGKAKEVENTTAYIQGWIKRLKEDDHAIFRAASLAEQAVRFLFPKKKEEEKQEQEEEQEA